MEANVAILVGGANARVIPARHRERLKRCAIDRQGAKAKW
jgi:hypothetical protein